MNKRDKPVTGPDGTVYPSRSAAGRALGCDASTITRHLNRFGNLDLVGMGKTPVAKGRRQWPSIVAAARDLGVTKGLIQQNLRKHGNLDRLGKWGGRRYSKPIQIGPVKWDAQVDAIRDLGISKPTLYAWLSPDASPEQREMLMARVMAVAEKREKRVAHR